MRAFLKKIIPTPLFRVLQPIYHFLLAFLGALIYRFPSRHINVVAVTGTKGKTTTTELLNAILTQAGQKTALASTLRFKCGDVSEQNFFKMTMPGRFFLQRFIRQAVAEKCDTIIIEMTSEGAKQFRHRFISLNALIFTNLAPEHIESHGSFEKYKEAKLSIVRQLERSRKPKKVLVVNKDDTYASEFLDFKIAHKQTFSLDGGRVKHTQPHGMTLSYQDQTLTTRLTGLFNASNILAVATYAQTQNITLDTLKQALLTFPGVPGRVEYIDEGQSFTVVVDYAHTPDSLEKLYEAFVDKDIIAVLGNTGGGRDVWKRPEMGRIADQFCTHITLTNEDPYDEDPLSIVEQMKKGITRTPVDIELDRRVAIGNALRRAQERSQPEKAVVLITGKGTDPFIMGPNGTKIIWDDARVTREELRRILS